MSEDEKGDGPAQVHDSQPFRVRLPGFVTDGEIGLGDVMGKAASYAGIRPCGGCSHRATTLNSWVVFSGRRSR